MYYNYIQQIKDLYEIMDTVDKKYHNTLRILTDEVMYDFMNSHTVPFAKQGEFLEVMFTGCKKIIDDYKTKKFDC